MSNRVVEILIQVKEDALGFFAKLGEAISSVKDHVFSLSGVLEAFVSGAIIKGLSNLVEIFAQTDMVITRVNAALQISGRYSREGSEEIQKMAVSMQNLTAVSREAALEVSATIAALARELSPTQLAEVQKAAIGLSETFGISLDRASSLIGRTLEGSFNALHRYGIELDLSASQQDRFNELMTKVGPLFEISKEAANTFWGAIEQAKNQFVELERTMGEIIANVFGLGTPKSIRDVFKNMNAEIRAHAGEWVHYGRIVVDALGVIASGIITAFRELIVFFTSDPVVKFLGWIFTTLDKVVGGIGDLLKNAQISDVPDLSGAVPPEQDPKKNALVGYLDSLLAKIGTIHQSWQKMMDEISGKAPTVTLAPIGAQEHGGLQNIAGPEFDTTAAVLHETAAVKDLVESQKLLNQERIAGRNHSSDYIIEQNRVVLGLLDERHTVEQLLAREDLEFKQRTALKVLLTEIDLALHKLTTEGLSDAEAKTKELTLQEANLKAEYDAGIISLDTYNARLRALRPELQAVIDVVKAMINSGTLTPEEMAKALALIDKLTKALHEAGGAAKSLGTSLKEALGAGTTKPIEEATAAIAASAKTWEDAWTKSAAASMAAGQTSLKGIGKAIQVAAKQEEAMMLADALKYLAHAAFDSVFNQGAVAFDLEAAALSTAAAGAYALIAGGGGGSGGGGGGGSGAAGANATSQAVQNQANTVTIIVPPGLTNSQAWVEELVGNIHDAGDRRVVIKQGGE